jgi:hypothetical protein
MEAPQMATGAKRYNLVLPQELFDEVQRIAAERHSTVVEVLRQFIRLGLLVAQAEQDPNAAFIYRQGDKERAIMLV